MFIFTLQLITRFIINALIIMLLILPNHLLSDIYYIRLESSIDTILRFDRKERDTYKMRDIQYNGSCAFIIFLFFELFTYCSHSLRYQDIAAFKRKFINYSCRLKIIYTNSSNLNNQ